MFSMALGPAGRRRSAIQRIDFTPKYAALKAQGVVEVICDFCAGAFKVKEELKQAADAKLDSEVDGHPDVRA